MSWYGAPIAKIEIALKRMNDHLPHGFSGPRLAAVGENCIDVYLPPTELSAVGGNAVNVAVGWARAGLASRYVGVVGPDEDGRRIAAALAAAGVDADLAVVDGTTAVSHVAVDGGGERELRFEDFGVGAGFVPDAASLAALADRDWIHCTLPAGPDAVVAALPGVPLSYDFSTRHDEHDPAGLAVAFLSGADAPGERIAALARRTLERGAACAIVTCGRHGSLGADAAGIVVVDALPIAPVDTLGAGDAYIAAFVARRAAGADLRTAMEAGTAAAAEACGHLAGFPQELRPTNPMEYST
jgi:fructoselysine 6-kinase